MIPPELLSLLRIALVTQCILCFQMNFRIDYSISVKNDDGILKGTALILQIALSMRMRDFFHFLVSSLISFFKVL
jgi:hypothetical protein